MYTILKELLAEKITAGLPSVKHIDWYNRQEENTEKQKAINYPAVYIEILDPINWEEASAGLQVANMRVKLHVVVFDLKDEPDAVMTLTQSLFLILQGKALFRVSDQKQFSSKMVRVSSEFQKRYNQLKKMSLTFGFAYFDDSSTPATTPVSNVQLNLTTTP